MKTLLILLLFVVVAVSALGYWQGWFGFKKTTDGGKPIYGVTLDPEKFKQDKEILKQRVSEQTKALQEKIAGLKKKSEGQKGEEKAKTDDEIVKLEKKHGSLNSKLKEIEEAAEDKWEGIEKDLKKDLEDEEEDKP
jgi:TolA-binding protein